MACSVNSTHAFGLLYCDWETQLHVFLFFRYVPPGPVPYSWKCRTIHRYPCLFSPSPSSLQALHKLCGSREITVLEGLTRLEGVAVWSSGHELMTMAIFWTVHFVQFLRLQQPRSMGGLHQPSKTQFLLASWAFISPFLTLHVLFWI